MCETYAKTSTYEQHGRERAFKWICSAEHPESSDDVQWNGVRLKTVTTVLISAMPYNNTINYRYICNYTYNYNYNYCMPYRVHSCISFGTWSCLLRVFNNLIGAPASFAGMCKFKDFLQLCECIMPLEITVLLLFLLRFVVVCCLRQTWFHSKCCSIMFDQYDFTRLSQPGRDDVGPWQGLQAFGIGSNQLRLARGCHLSIS